MRDVNILLGDEFGPRFLYVGKAGIGDVGNIVGGVRTPKFLTRSLFVLFAAAEGSFVLSELLFELGDFEDGEELALLDVRSPIDVELLNVAGDFGVHVDFLKGKELRGDFEIVRKILACDLDDGDGGRVSVIGFGLTRRAASSENDDEEKREQRAQDPEVWTWRRPVRCNNLHHGRFSPDAALCAPIGLMFMNFPLERFTQFFNRKLRTPT